MSHAPADTGLVIVSPLVTCCAAVTTPTDEIVAAKANPILTDQRITSSHALAAVCRALLAARQLVKLGGTKQWPVREVLKSVRKFSEFPLKRAESAIFL